jgi:hypothetical protein
MNFSEKRTLGKSKRASRASLAHVRGRAEVRRKQLSCTLGRRPSTSVCTNVGYYRTGYRLSCHCIGRVGTGHRPGTSGSPAQHALGRDRGNSLQGEGSLATRLAELQRVIFLRQARRNNLFVQVTFCPKTRTSTSHKGTHRQKRSAVCVHSISIHIYIHTYIHTN